MVETVLIERLAAAKYLPILSIRPAEMKALEELPELDKNLMLPLVLLRPWLGSNELENSLRKITEVYGNRTWIVDIDQQYDLMQEHGEGGEKQVIAELKALKDSANGYANWCQFIGANETMIPCVQLGDPGQVIPQIEALNLLGRGLVVRLPKFGFGNLEVILNALSSVDIDGLLFILDYGQASQADLAAVAICEGYLKKILEKLPNCHVAVSATSFPDTFDGIVKAPIKERGFYSSVAAQFPDVSIVYSDWGSARAQRNPGGGRIIPRIDYPTSNEWQFFRRDEDNGYVIAAKSLKAAKDWQPKMRVWGTQMIERTALDDPYAIVSPVRATAVRINLHMHRQLFFDNPELAIQQTDDVWVD